MKIRIIIVALALLAAAGSARAQDGTLDRVQNLIATGRLTEARNTLTDWERQNRDPAATVSSDDRARALYLNGLLTTDAKAAEDAFLGVVMSYPSSPVAPQALLRLGQSLYSAGETQRAITYLQRLRYDYPASSQRENGMLWLARAQLAMGEAAAACGTARESLLGTTNQNVRTLIELERDKACAQSGGIAEVAPSYAPAASAVPAPAAPPPAASAAAPLPNLDIAVDPVPGQAHRTDAPPPVTTRDSALMHTRTEPTPVSHVEPASQGSTTATMSGPEYAVQTAAFSERRAAETIVAELRARGFDARIVTVPGSPYFRVRYGTFVTAKEAAAAALRIRDAGFATLIVNDVRLERQP